MLLPQVDEVALADSENQEERRMPAATHRGNNSGPLVLLRGLRELAGAGAGAARAILFLSPTKGVP